MKDVRRRPEKEQEAAWEGENRDRCVDLRIMYPLWRVE
jgi:hypothetical protein